MPRLRLIIIILSASFSAMLSAESIMIVDQNGKPVQDAVISFPRATAIQPPSSHAVMDQVNKQFKPHVLTIQKGQWVDFPNSDEIRHHVYSFSEPKRFEIKMFKGSDAEPLQFENPGIVVLGCNIHDQMVAYIYVGNNETSQISNQNGFVEIDIEGDFFYVWHPRLSPNHSKRLQLPLAKSNGEDRQIVTLNLLPEKIKERKQRTFQSRKYHK